MSSKRDIIPPVKWIIPVTVMTSAGYDIIKIVYVRIEDSIPSAIRNFINDQITNIAK